MIRDRHAPAVPVDGARHRRISIVIFWSIWIPQFFNAFVPASVRTFADPVYYFLWPLGLVPWLKKREPAYFAMLRSELRFPGWPLVLLALVAAMVEYYLLWPCLLFLENQAWFSGIGLFDIPLCSARAGLALPVLIGYAVYMAATAAFVEELIYKPVLREVFGKWAPPFAVGAVSVLMFAAVHFEKPLLPIFMYGLVSAVLYFRFRVNLGFLMCWHFFIDLLFFSC